MENALDIGALEAYLISYFNSRMITKGKELGIAHDVKVPPFGSLQVKEEFLKTNNCFINKITFFGSFQELKYLF